MSEKDPKNKIMDSTLREVLVRIEEMVKSELWSRTFVAKCLLGFEQCLKVMGADYEMIDTLLLDLMESLPDVSFVTDHLIIKRFGEKQGREALDEVD